MYIYIYVCVCVVPSQLMIFVKDSHLVGADHIGDDQATDGAVRDHLGAPSAQHEMPTWIENYVDVLRIHDQL